MPIDDITLQQWIAHVFDHPVTDPEWHCAIDAPELDPGPERTASLIIETFERAGELLAPFSDAQLNQAFFYMLSGWGAGYMSVLRDSGVTWPVRQRALRSIVPLFEQVMAVRCTPHLSHLDEQPANPLNSSCYMWWDIFPLQGIRDEPGQTELNAEALSVLGSLLVIPTTPAAKALCTDLGIGNSTSLRSPTSSTIFSGPRAVFVRNSSLTPSVPKSAT